jgi:hypothetical protein
LDSPSTGVSDYQTNDLDGFAIDQAPSDTAIEAIQMIGRSTGVFVKGVVVPIMTSEEFKTLMGTAKQGAASYAPPGR